MTIQNIDQLLKRAGMLTPAERLLLANRLIQGVHNDMPAHKTHRKWKDALGLLPYPALGADAQIYISRARRADDNDRARVRACKRISPHFKKTELVTGAV